MSQLIRLPLRILALETAAILVTTALTALVAPRLLLLGPEHDDVLIDYCIATGATQLLWVAIAVGALTFSMRSALAASRETRPRVAVEPRSVIRLERLPTTLALIGFLGAVVAALLTWRRFAALGGGRPSVDVGVAIFAVNAHGAAQLLAYTGVRRATSAVLEQLPIFALREANGRIAFGRVRWTSLAGRIALASISSVAFVAVAAGLLLYAHERAEALRLRREAALDFAFGVYSGASIGGRKRAQAAARELGWQSESIVGSSASSQLADAEIVHPAFTLPNPNGAVHASVDGAANRVSAPLVGETYVVRFADPRTLPLGPLAQAALALILALAMFTGGLLGRAFERDLAVATAEVRALGASEVMRGVGVLHAARFAVVEGLLRAIDNLGALFTQFAAAHARATFAKEKTERMRGLFLASMSHDLKGPLNAVLGFAELVQREPLSEAQAESCTIIAQRGRELLHLIDTVLDAARIEANAFALSPERARLSQLLASSVATARELSSGSEVVIVDCVDADSGACFVDSARVKQAILSVILSAVRITKAGGMVQISVTEDPTSANFRVRVSSPAGALPQEELEQIFEAFRFAAQARKHGSLGLGLSLARTICEMHGGTLEVQRADAGVVFDLSVAVEQAPESLRSRSLPPPAGDSMRHPLKPPTGSS